MSFDPPQYIRDRTFLHKSVDLGYSDMAVTTTSNGRTYTTKDGVLLPSITTVLSIRSRGAIQEWRQRVGSEQANRIGRSAAGRGTALHSICERYISNIDPIFTGKEMPHVVQMFRSIAPIINKRIGSIWLQEKPLYSLHLGLAGRVDLVAEFDERLSIIDFKSSSKVKDVADISSYFIQESAYAIMFEERTGIPVDQLVTLMAVEGTNKVLVFVESRDRWTDELHKTIHEYNSEKLFRG